MKKKIIGSLLLVLALASLLSACGKKKQAEYVKYRLGDDGKYIVAGVTDAGKEVSEIEIPSSVNGIEVTSILRGAFREDTALKSIKMPDTIERIGENAFLSCTRLENIEWPSGLEYVGTNAVKGTVWEKAKLENSDEIIVGKIFLEYGGDKEEYQIPSGVEHIASGAFYNQQSLKQVVLPDGLVDIGNYAFSNCKSLEKVQLPKSLKNIGIGAFSECSKLEIVVPAGVATGQDAFKGVKELKKTDN
jgi:hypothetical protein